MYYFDASEIAPLLQFMLLFLNFKAVFHIKTFLQVLFCFGEFKIYFLWAYACYVCLIRSIGLQYIPIGILG